MFAGQMSRKSLRQKGLYKENKIKKMKVIKIID